MTRWNPKTKPTPANIRKRVGAAQDAIDGALDLMKQHPGFGPRDYKQLVNAYDWLVAVQRRLNKR